MPQIRGETCIEVYMGNLGNILYVVIGKILRMPKRVQRRRGQKNFLAYVSMQLLVVIL